MAEKKPEADDTVAPKPKGKLLLFLIIGVLAVVLGGAGAYLALKKKPSADDMDATDGGSAKTEKTRKERSDVPPVFVKFEPFTVKLQAESDQQQQDTYLQTTTDLRVLDAATGERVKQYTPEIRHKVLLLLSGKKPSDLSNPQGVQRLANELRDAINVIIDGPKTSSKGKTGADGTAAPSDTAAPDDSVQAVLFTSFIIQ